LAQEKINRRGAMGRVLKIMAVATGLSISEVRSLLFSQVRTRQASKQRAVILRKSANKSVKLLKVLLENSKDVFENEFGRSTPFRKTAKAKVFVDIQSFLPRNQDMRNNFMDHFADIVNVCGANFGVPGGIPGVEGFICAGVNTCTGQDVDGGSGCAGTNECNGQSCDSYVCSGNDCDEQSCGEFDYCENNKSSIIDILEIDRFKADPYIQVLFERFNVSTTAELLAQVNSMLSRRRVELKRRIIR